MPHVYMDLAQGDRVHRPVSGAEASLGTVTAVAWESTAGARYFIRWDGSPLARRYTAQLLQEQGIKAVPEGHETGNTGRTGG